MGAEGPALRRIPRHGPLRAPHPPMSSKLPSLLPHASTPLPRFIAGQVEAEGAAWDVPDRAAGGFLFFIYQMVTPANFQFEE